MFLICIIVSLVIMGIISITFDFTQMDLVSALLLSYPLAYIESGVIKWIKDWKNNINEIKLNMQQAKSIDLDYYRNIIKEINIGQLACLYNKKIDSDLLIALIVKNLKNQNKIIVKNHTLYALKDLTREEEILIGNYKSWDTEKFKKYYKNLMLKKIKNNNFEKDYTVEQKENVKKNNDAVFVLSAVILFFGFMSESMVSLFSLIIFLVIMVVKTSETKIVIDYKLYTKQGNELLNKLKGLKNYLKEFGNFDEKKLKEIKFYDEYILYVVMFGISDKLESELRKEYKEMKESFIN